MFGVLKANFETVYDLAYDFHQEHVATYQQYAGCADFVFYVPAAAQEQDQEPSVDYTVTA